MKTTNSESPHYAIFSYPPLTFSPLRFSILLRSFCVNQYETQSTK